MLLAIAVGLRRDFGSDRFELGRQSLRDRVELRARGVELRVSFFQLHSEGRIDAVYFRGELVDVCVH